MKLFYKTSYFWLLFTLISCVAGGIAIYYFPQANAIIHLELTMNRTQAIADAQAIADQFALGPKDASSAATFYTNEAVKTFVEWEGGGKKAVVAMMEQKLYYPYTWIVRRFKPFDQHELLMQFTPSGTPYGFEETISEETIRPNIPLAAAQKNAEQFAQAAPWYLPLVQYTLIETSQETQTGGRIDHTFVYERTKEKVGNGFYRLKLVVRGDQVSELSHAIKIPDAFTRQYEQIRSVNENIAYGATIIMVLLYVLGGCFGGLFFLFKKRWLIWRMPSWWAFLIALLFALNIPNQLPFYWMHYNTAVSPFGFLFNHGLSILYIFIFLSALLTIIFTAAESLSRRAFSYQPQLWKLYNPQNASSYTVLGQTVAAYLLVPILFCYTILFYLITTQWFGWWNPASTLFNPNILATYLPWLESISFSLQAGFLEECLFRAVPLASAALLGSYFGKRNWGIALMFIFQALVFGAAHANYPAQPAYARVIELLADSFLFGGIYLWLGLLPVIITHFVYDVIWFALPIFVSTAPGALGNKIIIILLAFVPLCIVLLSRLKIGRWHPLSSDAYNGNWHALPEKSSLPKESHKTLPPQIITVAPLTRYSIYAVGILGIIIWISASKFSDDAPSFTTSRSVIAEKSREILQTKNIDPSQWTMLISPLTHYKHQRELELQHRFIWQQGDTHIYHSLLGTYLMPAYWKTRLVKFNGPIEQRAEEYQFLFKPDGSLVRFSHIVPETRAATSINQQEAQTRARKTIQSAFGLPPDQLNLVAAISNKQPERLDWVITYSSSTDYPLAKGSARVAVEIAGDEIVDAYRAIHVPEEWKRSEQNNQMFTMIAEQIAMMLIYLFTIIGIFLLIQNGINWQSSLFLALFALIGTLSILQLFNIWPSIIMHFNTSQPFYDQLFRSYTLSAIIVIARAAVLAFVIMMIIKSNRRYQNGLLWQSIAYGISLGSIFMGTKALLIALIPSREPIWANVEPLAALFPLLAGIITSILFYLTLTIQLYLYTLTLTWISARGKKRLITILFALLSGYAIRIHLFAYNPTLLSISGICFALVFYIGYYAIIRFDFTIIPILAASCLILENLQQLFYNGYPLAPLSALIASILIAGAGIAWGWRMRT